MPKKIKEAVVLAGGLGTRLRSVVADVPKPMAPINGRPFLELLLDYWISQGVEHFILCLGYKAGLVVDHFAASYHGARITYSVEDKPLGTGGALLQSLQHVEEANSDFLLLNGDTFYSVSLEQLQVFHLEKQSSLTMSLYRVKDNDRYTGIVLDKNQAIIALNDSKLESNVLINAGVYLINQSIFNGSRWQSEVLSFESDILPELIKKKVYGFQADSKFIDIGVPSDYAAAQSLLI